jgi:hypothetical protein
MPLQRKNVLNNLPVEMRNVMERKRFQDSEKKRSRTISYKILLPLKKSKRIFGKKRKFGIYFNDFAVSPASAAPRHFQHRFRTMKRCDRNRIPFSFDARGTTKKRKKACRKSCI